jgi:putative tricarboxylic transport membrane protein
LIGFGLLGFLMAKFGFPSAPLVLGFVLGDAMERALRQSMAMSEGDPTILVARPISAFLLAAAFVILVSPLWRKFRRARARRAAEQNAASPTLPQR